MTRANPHDNGTDRRLVLLVGLVVFAAAVAVLLSVHNIVLRGSTTPRDLARAATVTFLVAVGATVNVRIRIRATNHGVSWTEVASVVGLAVAPVPWVIIATGLGVAIARAIPGLPPIKLAFGIAKETVLAAVGGMVLILAGWSWPWTGAIAHSIPTLAAAYLTVVVLDELLDAASHRHGHPYTARQPLLGTCRPADRKRRCPLRRNPVDTSDSPEQPELPRHRSATRPEPAPRVLEPRTQPGGTRCLATPRPYHRRTQRGRPGQSPDHRRHPGHRTLLRGRG